MLQRAGLLLGVGLLSGSCAQFMSVPEEKGPSTNSCQARALIDDAEDADDQLALNERREGYWYTFKDETGSDVHPREDKFSMDSGGVGGSSYAVRLHGQLSTGAEVYAGVGFDFLDQHAQYDASRYTGISFLAKRTKDSVAMVRLKAPDANTDPAAKLCTDCYNDFGVTFELSEEWTRYAVKFDDLKQEDGWGDPRPAHVASDKLFGLQWQVSTPNGKFDIYLDDIRFEGCP